MNLVYLGSLLVVLVCMALLDRRFRLFFWFRPRRAAAVTLVGVVVFVIWDLLGIGLGVFRSADPHFLTGIMLAPHLPLEELFFLTFLCYFTMVLVSGIQLLVKAREGRTETRADGDAL